MMIFIHSLSDTTLHFVRYNNQLNPCEWYQHRYIISSNTKPQRLQSISSRVSESQEMNDQHITVTSTQTPIAAIDSPQFEAALPTTDSLQIEDPANNSPRWNYMYKNTFLKIDHPQKLKSSEITIIFVSGYY